MQLIQPEVLQAVKSGQSGAGNRRPFIQAGQVLSAAPCSAGHFHTAVSIGCAACWGVVTAAGGLRSRALLRFL